MGLGTLAIGTSGYSMTGLLPAMSTHLHITPAVAGQLLTVFAVTCAVAGPILTIATRRWDRRRLLTAALAVTAAGNVMAAVVPTVPLLFVARFVTGLGTAVYTAGAASMAAQLNKPERRARAIAVVFGGLTLALLLGVPSVMALSAPLGYQGTFWLVAALCAFGGLLIRLVVPRTRSTPRRDGPYRAARINRHVRGVLVAALLASLSSFAVYTYISALLNHITGAERETIAGLLVGYGIGAAIGNSLGGRATDHYGPRRVLLVAIGLCATLLAALPVTATTVPGAAATLVMWGCAFWAVNPPLSSWLIQRTPQQTDDLLSLLASSIYLGMGIGGLLGGVVVSLFDIGLLPNVAGILAAVAFVVVARTDQAATITCPPPCEPGRTTSEIIDSTST
ncbi:MFS transporter [Actinophytocola sp.]|uniref:MFS transporter n=1 Tax=Actinophytocola sp. TaxID=1872138 RepID=UPI003D6C2D72